MFGELVKKLRAEKRLGLREFCIEIKYDPSNWSKIERGILPPPQDQELLTRICSTLELAVDSDDGQKLLDFAAVSAGKIPDYVMKDAELVGKLPVFFRTATGKKPTSEELDQLAEILRDS